MSQIEIYWIRHGYSCANLLKSFKYYGHKDAFKSGHFLDSRARYAQDSPITNLIKYQKKNHPIMRGKFDLVLSSELTRAIQTACHLRPSDQVYPIPYIGEMSYLTSISRDNLPTPPNQLKKLFEKDSFYQKVNFSFMEKILGSDRKNSSPNQKKFYNQVLPFISQYLRKTNNKKKYKIIIVSHQKFLNNLIKTKYKIPNLGLYRQTINFAKNQEISESKFELLYPTRWNQSIPVKINQVTLELNPNLEEYHQNQKKLILIVDDLISNCGQKYIGYLNTKLGQTKKISRNKVSQKKINAKHYRTKRKTS